MKKGLHPETFNIKATCACGNSFETASTEEAIKVTLCSQCHPFFTGQQKFVDTAGRIEKFNKKFGNASAAKTKVKKS